MLLGRFVGEGRGHPDAERLLADITAILHTRFWDRNVGVTTEEYAPTGNQLADIARQNSNMLT